MKAKLPFPRRIPFVEELGLELWAFGDGKAELRVDLAEAHLNYWQVAHGGVLETKPPDVVRYAPCLRARRMRAS